ncbi:MAG: S41 family peptidase [Phycisphaerales bacterium]|jgi:carboxyl-terminal processing protease|nr:S41 family peptidase [Phycisphaerales bacterium]
MNTRQILPPILLIAMAAILATTLPSAIAGRARNYDWFSPVIDTRSILMNGFVELPDESAMQQAAIEAIVESLDDPYTMYVAPSHTDEFQKDLSGHYVGIGAHVNGRAGRLEILSPMDGSPALEAGVRAGDVILMIDDFDTKGQPVQTCIDELLGEPGSEVRVHVRHTDESEEWLTVVRQPITAPTVSGLARHNQAWRYHLDESRGLAYARVNQFTMDTVPQLLEALEPLTRQGPLNGLVLDLRGNPGGALPAAIDMAELFLDGGEIVSIAPAREDRTDERRTATASPGEAFEGTPMVVLIDEHSASASEIVAGALRDNNRAMIVGERSFGKGSVQEVRPLDDDMGMLKFTTAYYFVPSGRNIHRRRHLPDEAWGVDPSPGCVVPETPEDMLKRVERRWVFDAITDDEPDLPQVADEAWLRTEYNDPALAEAMTLLRHHHAHQDWPELDEDEDPAFPPLQADLDAALDRREAFERHLVQLNDEILRLMGSEATVERGLVGLDEDVDMAGAEITLRAADGSTLGTWRVAENEDIRASLGALELEPVTDDGKDDAG